MVGWDDPVKRELNVFPHCPTSGEVMQTLHGLSPEANI